MTEVEDGGAPALEGAKAPDLPTPFVQLRRQVRLLERGYDHGEVEDARRVLRSLRQHRRLLNTRLLNRILNASLPAPVAANLALTLPVPTPLSAPSPSASQSPSCLERKASTEGVRVPEVEIFLHILVTLFHLDRNEPASALRCAKVGVEKLEKPAPTAKSTLDPIAARLYYYYLLANERADASQGREEPTVLRSWLLHRLHVSVATHHTADTTAVLINAILRSFCFNSPPLYAPALEFLRQVDFPRGANDNEEAKYAYYVGLVASVEQNWVKAATALEKALLKPNANTLAVGFHQSVMKLKLLVDMLAGKDFPPKALLEKDIYRRCLGPYRKLALAVRVGDISSFKALLEKDAAVLRRDGTLEVARALRVLTNKTALRNMARAYSHQNMAHIRDKLGLDSLEDAEYCLLRAIRDGWVSARLQHTPGAGGSLVHWKGSQGAGTGSGDWLLGRADGLNKVSERLLAAMRFPAQAWLHQLRAPGAAQEEQSAADLRLLYALHDADDDDPDDDDTTYHD